METSAGERINFTIDRISDKPTVNNRVLVRIDQLPEDGYKLSNGLVIAGSKWNETAHVARWGVVEQVPERLKIRPYFNFQGALEWSTEMELTKGDVVFFTKMESANAPVFNIDGQTYYLVNYGEIVLRLRDEELYPLNGYCIVEKVVETVRRDGLILDFGEFQNKQLGIVRHVGKPNAYYFGSDTVDADVQEGDKVIFEGNYWTELEYELFAQLDSDLGFVQRCWINGKIEEHEYIS